MKRFRTFIAFAVLGSMMITGCGGGLDEGLPKEIPKSGQTAEFKAYQMKNADKMKMKKPAKKAASE